MTLYQMSLLAPLAGYSYSYEPSPRHHPEDHENFQSFRLLLKFFCDIVNCDSIFFRIPKKTLLFGCT